MNSIVSGLDLKSFITSSRSIKVNSGGIYLEPRRGQAILDFSSIPSKKCTLIMSRVSGNGKFRLFLGENLNNFVVASKMSQKFDIELDGPLKIDRNGGVGEIIIKAIEFKAQGREELGSKWKGLVKKCGKYKGLRLTGDELCAANGGFLEKGDVIEEIETSPPNLFRRKDGKVIFVGTCKITKLKIKDSLSAKEPIAPFPERNAPSPALTPQVSPKTSPTKIVSSGMAPPRNNEIHVSNPLAAYDYVVYDSLSVNGFNQFKNSKDKKVKHIRSNGVNYLAIKHRGRAQISISDLEENREYICIIEAKKLSGNGKTQLAFTVSNANPTQIVETSFDNNFSNKYVTLKTGSKQYGSFFNLFIAKSETSVGEIIIKRVMIVRNIDVSRAHTFANLKPFSPRRSENIGSLSFSYSLSSELVNDPVFQVAKRYSRQMSFNNPMTYWNQIDSKFLPTTVSGMSWVSKITNFLPNSKLLSNRELIDNKTMVIGSVGSLEGADRMWIDHFEEGKLSEVDIEKIKRAKTIFTPSPSNKDVLEKRCPGPNIYIRYKPLPYTNPRPIPYLSSKQYILVLHRNQDATKRILDSIAEEISYVVLLGARGAFEKNVIPINEYLPYDNLISLIVGAKCLVDIPKHHNYKSSFLELAIKAGIPTVSTNRSIMNRPNAFLLEKDSLERETEVPSKEALSSTLLKAFNTKPIEEVNLLSVNDDFVSISEDLSNLN